MQKTLFNEPVRFIANGVVATTIHYLVLTFSIISLNIESMALAGLLASVFGVSASFLGCRYLVFLPVKSGAMASQLKRFLPLYLATSLLHTSFFFIFGDLGGVDYRLCFALATGLQVSISYFFNKHFIFLRV
jgi:putative flippase GtrA